MSSVERLVALVRRHQAGLLLDTNVLLLHLADQTGPAFAQRWRATAHFGDRFLIPLRAAVRAAARLVTTPHVLTEVSNFATEGARLDSDYKRLQELLRQFALHTKERSVRSSSAASDHAFSRLGLTDVAMMLLSSRRRPLVLTVDAPLMAEFEKRGLPVANLTHYAFPPDEFQP